MEAIKYNARAFARLGQCGTVFGIGATAMREHQQIVCLSADMSRPAGLDRFKRTYPESFINVGIAEQNMIGIAAGLEAEGYRPVCVTQAAFLSMRCYEQVRQYMGYMGHKIVLVGLSAGFALTFLGNTHYAIEDIALMRAIPGMTILSPADAGSALKAFEYALSNPGPTYIRLSGETVSPIVYDHDFEYKPTHMKELADYGTDAAIMATGSMVHQVLKAAELLNEQGIGCKVYDVECIKPLDTATVHHAMMTCKNIYTVEEHNVIGGLGSAVAEVLAEQANHAPLRRIGVNDNYSPVGEYTYLLKQHALDAESIAQRIAADANAIIKTPEK